MSVSISYSVETGPAGGAIDAADQLTFVGTKATLTRADVMALVPASVRNVWPGMLEALAPGDGLASTTTWTQRSDGAPWRVTVVAISERASRHNAPGRPDLVTAAVKGRAGKGKAVVIVALERRDDAFAAGCAVARAFPVYARRKKPEEAATLEVVLLHPDGVSAGERRRIEVVAGAVRLAQRLVDMPAAELHTDALVAEAEAVAAQVGATISVISGAALAEKGMGGLVGVGQAAVRGPALVHLCHDPTEHVVGAGASSGAHPAMAWVGKGIVYDTGGLSLKGKTDMPGMKNDMGGAAAVLAAFRAVVELGVGRRVDAILCLAENSVGPNAMRPDDIITLYSGKTVEVNNTDAEGRLVLADGVAYATKDLKAPIVVDVATLTGAQLVATGKMHAGVVSNDEMLEAQVVSAGRRSGDLCFPMPYAPELFRAEFASPVADMRNSVKDRMNAQASCAAQFVAEALAEPATRWLHVDIAGPVSARDRGTGFGVALLVELAGMVA